MFLCLPASTGPMSITVNMMEKSTRVICCGASISVLYFLFFQSPSLPQIHESEECKFPEVNPFDPKILEIAGLDKKTLVCDDFYLPEITYIDNYVIRVNSSKVNETYGLSHCKYRNITRPPYKDNEVWYSGWSEPFTEYINITREHEFLFVECHGAKNKTEIVSEAFYSLVPKGAHLKQFYDVALKKRQVDFEPEQSLSVVAVMLDGLPRHQMMRGMPKTYGFLKGNLKSFDFTMHVQAGANTLPNLVNLFSPNTFHHTTSWWDFSKPEDVFDLIWRDFERAGYRTLFSEDLPKGAGFYWGNRKFLYPQTTHWNRPLELAMEERPGFLHKDKFCAGPRPISEFQLEYLEKFLDTFPRDPVAGMSIITRVTHDDMTNAKLIDEHILKFYQRLEKKGHLNRSLVIFFSDHGSRWGEIRQTYNGIVESRNPFLMLTFPPWFTARYPKIAQNLETNTRRLTSHPDTRQMLLDLLYFKGRQPTPPYRGRHGVSLFGEITPHRTCSEAAIPESQCLCGLKIEHLNPASPRAKVFARTLLKAVRKKSDLRKCKKYYLDKVEQLRVLTAPTFQKGLLVCSVRIIVKPGGAKFEGKVTLDKRTRRISVGNNIERLNMYRGERECMPTSREQIYCYCKSSRRYFRNTKRTV